MNFNAVITLREKTMSKRKAIETLKHTGTVHFRGFDIWETVSSGGEYTQRYRMAPRDAREHYRDYEPYTRSITSMFKHLSVRGHVQH
jgi:hypothetical protein